MQNLSPPPRRDSNAGKYVSFAIFIAMFTLYPAVVKYIWPYVLENLQQPFLYQAVLVATGAVVLFPYNIVMYFIYQAKIPFFQQYRCSNKPWPWESNPALWREMFKKTIGTCLFNLFVLNSVMPFVQILTGGIKYKSSLQDWPSALTMILQVAFFIFFEDFGFYWTHKLLHQPEFYWIHKKHHEYNITVTIASTYSHPLQYFLSNILPTGLSYHLLAKVMPVHYITIIVWLTLRLMETCDGHSGYDWSWGQLVFIPWKLDGDYHDFHHSKNVGNYGSMFSFWDNYMKSNEIYRKEVLKVKQI